MADWRGRPRCEYCHKYTDQLELVNITKHVTVLICPSCYKIISQVSRYPKIEIKLLKGGD